MPAVDDPAAAVREAEDRRYRAMIAADIGTLADLLSDSLVYSHSNATRDTKESLLAKIADGSIVYRAVEHPVEQVTVLGDTVLVAGQMRGEVVLDSQPKRLNNSVLAVWSVAAGTWQLAAFQPTPLPS